MSHATARGTNLALTRNTRILRPMSQPLSELSAWLPESSALCCCSCIRSVQASAPHLKASGLRSSQARTMQGSKGKACWPRWQLFRTSWSLASEQQAKSVLAALRCGTLARMMCRKPRLLWLRPGFRWTQPSLMMKAVIRGFVNFTNVVFAMNRYLATCVWAKLARTWGKA